MKRIVEEVETWDKGTLSCSFFGMIKPPHDAYEDSSKGRRMGLLISRLAIKEFPLKFGVLLFPGG